MFSVLRLLVKFLIQYPKLIQYKRGQIARKKFLTKINTVHSTRGLDT
jgi:hypothetical protein